MPKNVFWQVSGSTTLGTTVHFEKHLEWLPGAAGELLFQEASTLAAESALSVDSHD